MAKKYWIIWFSYICLLILFSLLCAGGWWALIGGVAQIAIGFKTANLLLIVGGLFRFSSSAIIFWAVYVIFHLILLLRKIGLNRE